MRAALKTVLFDEDEHAAARAERPDVDLLEQAKCSPTDCIFSPLPILCFAPLRLPPQATHFVLPVRDCAVARVLREAIPPETWRENCVNGVNTL